jgi:hypothetical protein
MLRASAFREACAKYAIAEADAPVVDCVGFTQAGGLSGMRELLEWSRPGGARPARQPGSITPTPPGLPPAVIGARSPAPVRRNTLPD